MGRTKEEWLRIFADQTNGQPDSVGYRILGDMVGYHHKSQWRKQDALSLGAALDAWIEFKDILAIRSLDNQ